jgi:hypothetical protein
MGLTGDDTLRPALIGAKSCDEKLKPQLFGVYLPALSTKSCMKNQVGPISTCHQKVAVKSWRPTFTSNFSMQS